jgi:hypothetical protein
LIPIPFQRIQETNASYIYVCGISVSTENGGILSNFHAQKQESKADVFFHPERIISRKKDGYMGEIHPY